MRTIFTWSISLLFLMGCGQMIGKQLPTEIRKEEAETHEPDNSPETENPEIVKAIDPPTNSGTNGFEDRIIKGKVELPLNMSLTVFKMMRNLRGEVSATVTNPVQTTFVLDTSRWRYFPSCGPEINYGAVKIDQISDNDLHRCGKFQNEHCSRAIIWAYVQDLNQTEAGKLSGMSFFVRISETEILPIQRSSVKPTILEAIRITSEKHHLGLNDFKRSASYEVFAMAGKGTNCNFRGALVVEYLLM